MQARLLWLVLWWSTLAYGARLLAVLPTNTKSHHVMYGRILEALAKRHHNLTIITHFPMKKPLPNVREISLAGTKPEIQNNLNSIKHNSIVPRFIRNLEQIMEECVESCEIVSRVPEVQALLNSSETFDLIIVEVFGSDCFLPFSVKYSAPVIGLLSSVPLPWVNEQLGNPEATSYVPSYMVGYGQRMTLWQRFANTMSVIIAKLLYKYKSQVPSQIIADKLFGPGPKLESLARNYSLVLSNSHFSINEVRPLVPALIEVGGLHLDDVLTLPNHMKSLLDVSIEGVVYWSFGSMSRIETIPIEVLSKIFNIMSGVSQTVLIKMDRERLASNITVPDNVYTMKWIPQHATLCHPNMKLFISHGGLLGTQEAVACGVPMLMVPLYADQALNARGMVERGVAEIVKLEEPDIDNWRLHIRSLLSNPMYKENALKLKEVFLDRPMKPLDLGIYWIEYVLRHKGALHLRSPALDLSLSQYFLLDTIVISTVITLLNLYVLHKLFRYLCTRCVKWWPMEKLVFEKKLLKRNISIFLCILYKYKIKTN